MEDKYAKDLIYENNSPICVLILHGLSSNPYDMKRLADTISEEGFDVIVPVLPLHGVNQEELLKLKDPSIFYEWSNKKIREIRTKYEKLIIIGFSMGAGMTFISEAKEPLADGFIGISTGGIFSLGLRIFAFLSKFIKINSVKLAPNTYTNPSQEDKEYLAWKAKHFTRMPMQILVHAVRYSRQMKKNVKKLTLPFLIVYGTKDQATSKRTLPFLIEKSSSKYKKGIILEGGEHVVLNSPFHNLITENVLKFIHEVLEYDSSSTELFSEIVKLSL